MTASGWAPMAPLQAVPWWSCIHPVHLGRVDVIHAHDVIVLEEQVVGPVDIVKANQIGASQLLDAFATGHIAGVVDLVMAEHGHASALCLRIQQFVGLVEVVAHRFFR